MIRLPVEFRIHLVDHDRGLDEESIGAVLIDEQDARCPICRKDFVQVEDGLFEAIRHHFHSGSCYG